MKKFTDRRKQKGNWLNFRNFVIFCEISGNLSDKEKIYVYSKACKIIKCSQSTPFQTTKINFRNF